jgi:chromate transporter
MISFKEFLSTWFKVMALSFGGPANQIAVMHRLVVDERKWVTEEKFLQALNYCMLLPGPEAHQLAIYLGWRTHGVKGGIIAGTLFVFPGFISMLVLSILYMFYHQTIVFQNLLVGLKAAVIAIIIEALLRISQRVLKTKIAYGIAVLSFLAIFIFNVPFPLILLLAAVVGVIQFYNSERLPTQTEPSVISVDVKRSLKIAAMIAAGSWGGLVLVLIVLFGHQHILSQQAIFFSKVSLVTFGGAYSILAYVVQQAVEYYAWLSPSQMVDGLGFAETMPGPLIKVCQFVAFVGAYSQAAGMNPLIAGILASVVTTWVVFVPSFVWIFAGIPSIEKFSTNVLIKQIMSAITAAVLGTIASLALWFSVHSYFGVLKDYAWQFGTLSVPDMTSIHWEMILISVLSLYLLIRTKFGLIPIIAIGVAFGLLFSYLGI